MNKTETKPKYVPNSEVELWDYLNKNQGESFKVISSKFGITEEQVRKLTILWAAGAKDSFNQAYYSIFDGSPTGW